jgi:hypothetical protein
MVTVETLRPERPSKRYSIEIPPHENGLIDVPQQSSPSNGKVFTPA